MFLGSEVKKDVSLRGASSKQQTKEELIDRARAERDARALERRRKQAAQKIARIWRSSKARHEERNQERKRFDEMVRSCLSSNILPLMRSFVSFYVSSVDDTRFAQMAILFLTNSSQYSTEKDRSSKHAQLRRFCIICIDDIIGKMEKKADPIDPSSRAMVCLNLAFKSLRFIATIDSLHHHLIESGIHNVFRRFILDFTSVSSPSTLQFDLKLLIEILTIITSPLSNPESNNLFIRNILTIPLLPLRVPESMQFFELCLEFLQQVPTVYSPDTGWTIGNLVQIASIVKRTPDLSLVVPLNNLLKADLADVDRKVSKDAYIDSNGALLARHQMSFLHSPIFVTSLFGSLIDAVENPIAAPQSFPPLPYISTCCELYVHALVKLPSLRLWMLSALALSQPPLAKVLWEFMNRIKSLDPQHLIERSDQSFPLILFCEIYSHMLMICDDDEFYSSSSQSFTIADVVTIVRKLREIIVRLYLIDRSVHSVALVLLRDSITRVLALLYQRNSRRPFVVNTPSSSSSSSHKSKRSEPTNLFVCPEIDFEQLLASDQHHGTARFMLHKIAWAATFETRLGIFSKWIASDRERTRPATLHHVPVGPTVRIRRTMMLEDAYSGLGGASVHTMRHQAFRIEFINNAGMIEPGVDLGGLFKEFLTNVLDEAFNPNRSGLFTLTPSHQLYPDPHSDLVFHGNREMLCFVGRCLGKAVYDGVVVDVALAPFFLSKLLGRKNYFDELASLDQDIHKGLVFVKNYSGNVNDLDLYFSVDEDSLGRMTTRDLLPNGRDLQVTNANRIQYCYLVADYYLNKRIDAQSSAIVKGFHEVIPVEWLRMFSPSELGMLITGRSADGSDEDIDIDDMQRHAVYENGFSSMSSTVRSFWKVARELSSVEKRKLVKFITGYPRAPLMGFGSLDPPLTIRCVDDPSVSSSRGIVGFLSGLIRGNGGDRLPSASVCFNALKLPDYRSTSVLREKLRYALNADVGFELS